MMDEEGVTAVGQFLGAPWGDGTVLDPDCGGGGDKNVCLSKLTELYS